MREFLPRSSPFDYSMKDAAKRTPRCGATSPNFNNGTCNRHQGHRGDHYDSNGNTWPRHLSYSKTDESKPSCVIASATDKVPTDWVDGKEMTVEQWGQREYDSGHKTGVRAGVTAAYTHVMQESTALFANGKDAEAIQLRGIAYGLLKLQK